MNQQVCVVVPSIREHSWNRFMKEWGTILASNTIILIEDNPKATFATQQQNVIHIAWDTIESALGSAHTIIPRRTDCVRSFGYLLAWHMGFDITITLDDDCYPINGSYITDHLNALSMGSDSAWTSTGQGAKPRGMPYFNTERKRKTIINHGLWTNIIDFDAVTQLMANRTDLNFMPIDQTIPVGKYYPMCGMNLAWLTDVTPMMYFLLMGRDYEYDRFGDIWCGIISKKISDHLGYSVRSGSPLVHHDRASNVFDNIVKESRGYELNERFWSVIDAIVLSSTSVSGCAHEIANHLESLTGYLQTIGHSYKTWLKYFSDESVRADKRSVETALENIRTISNTL